jgi:2-polyprenyl-3-methyl-5-hydroxy-6-metoxy-1,4-benzoquinol methylase
MKFSFKNLFKTKNSEGLPASRRIFSDGERQAPIEVAEAEPSHLARYQFALTYVSAGDKILDVPCGSGYGTKLLATKGSEVIGIDNSSEAIGHAEEFFQTKNNHFSVGDMEKLSKTIVDNAGFDVIVSFEGIEHIKNPEPFLTETKKLLKKGGCFIVSTPRKPHGSPYHLREYSLEEFISILEKDFEIKGMFGQIYTDIFELSKKNVRPEDYKRFNFIAICATK